MLRRSTWRPCSARSAFVSATAAYRQGIAELTSGEIEQALPALEFAADHGVLGAQHERQAPLLDALGHQLVEAGLEDRHLATAQGLDLLRHHVGADHPMPQVRQARARGEAHVARPDHRDPHADPLRPTGRKRPARRHSGRLRLRPAATSSR